jgi:FkbM family methyltransferase
VDARRILPENLHHTARALKHRLQIASGRFRSPEPEWDRLNEWLTPGDVAIDVGANIGHYAARMCTLVGTAGWIVAVEPVPATFALLTANARHFGRGNLTLLNLAASDTLAVVGLSVPDAGGYEAHLDAAGRLRCLAAPLDALAFPGPVRLIKIDAEGHEAAVLRGMSGLIARDRPIVIFEARREAKEWLESLGYHILPLTGRSPNLVAAPG